MNQDLNNNFNQNNSNIDNNSLSNNQSLNNNIYNQSQVSSNMYQQPTNQVTNGTINNQNNYSNINSSATGYQSKYNVSPKKKETLGTVSLVLGIISLALALFLNILILPVAITGLIFGIVNKTKKGKKIAGIVLNSVAILIVVVLIVLAVLVFKSVDFKDFFSTLYNELDYSTSENYVSGKYDCTGVDSNTDKYLVTLHLNEDNTFLFGPYDDLENNYAKGTYTYEDEHKTNNTGEYKYFMITFKGEKEDFIVNGEQSDHGFNSQMEFGLSSKNVKKQGVIMFVSTYNMYYCYEK